MHDRKKYYQTDGLSHRTRTRKEDRATIRNFDGDALVRRWNLSGRYIGQWGKWRREGI